MPQARVLLWVAVMASGLAWACLPAARCEADADCSDGRACLNGTCQAGGAAAGGSSGGITPSTSNAATTSSSGTASGATGGTSSSRAASSGGPSTSRLDGGVALGSSGSSSTSRGSSTGGVGQSSSAIPIPSSGGACTMDAQCGTAGGCITNARCNNGRCELFILPVNSACEDGDPCTHGESCNAVGQCQGSPGTCLPAAYDQPCTSDTSCSADGGFTCVTGRCRMDLGGTCVANHNCGSTQCVNGACCNEACDGICMACTAAGRCEGAPHDPACAPLNCGMYSDDCITFSNVTTALCAQKGVCKTLDRPTCLTSATVDPQPDGTPCRAANGGCDVAETCVAAACPSDGVHPLNHVCLPAQAGEACDLDDLCDGVAKACPARFQNQGTPCRTHGTCNAAETCTGTSPTCPADVPPVYQLGVSCDGGLVGDFLSQPPFAAGLTWDTFKTQCNTHCDIQAGAQCCYVFDFPGVNSPPVVIAPFWGCAAMAGGVILQDGGAAYEGYACGY